MLLMGGCTEELPEKIVVKGARMRTRPFVVEVSGIGTLVSLEIAGKLSLKFEIPAPEPEALEMENEEIIFPTVTPEPPEFDTTPIVEPVFTTKNAVAHFESAALANGLEEFEGLPLSLGGGPLVVRITFPEPPEEPPKPGSAVRALIVGEEQQAAPGILAFYDPDSQTGIAWVGFLQKPRHGTLINISVILRRYLAASFLPTQVLEAVDSDPYVNIYRPETRSVENIPVTIISSEGKRSVVIPALPPGALGLLDPMPPGELPENIQIQSVDLFPDQKKIHWSGLVIDVEGNDS